MLSGSMGLTSQLVAILIPPEARQSMWACLRIGLRQAVDKRQARRSGKC